MARARYFWSALFTLAVCMPVVGCGDDDVTPGTPTPQIGAGDPTATQAPTIAPTPTETPSPPPATPTAGPAVEPMAIVGTVPSGGAMAVPRFPSVQVSLSEALPAGQEGAVSAWLEGPDGTIPLFIDTDADVPGDEQLALLPQIPLALEADYQLFVSIDAVEGLEPAGGSWPVSWSSAFSTRVPCGVAFDIAKDIQINALGGNRALVEVLQGVLNQTGLAPIALQLVDIYSTQAFPVEGFQMVAGLPRYDGEAFIPDPAFGFPVSVEGCTIAPEAGRGCAGNRGWLSCDEATFVFPIPITDTTIIYLTISQASLSGCASNSGAFTGLSDFTVEGVITQDDLLLALDAAGVEGVADYVILDVDTNGDTIPDAASASASSEPVWMDFKDCDESGGGL